MKTNDLITYNNKRLKKAHIAALYNHGIEVVDQSQVRKTQVKVRALQFLIFGAQRCSSPLVMLVNEKFSWEEITLNYFYYEKELIEFALQCLYLTDTLLGECIVQRCRKKDLAVVEIRPLSYMELTDSEKQTLATNSHIDPNCTKITYGCDLEFMLENKQTNKFILADQLSKNSQIGFDDAICLNGEEVGHPIFEVRPKPANSMIELHGNLLCLHSKLVKRANVNQLALVTDANPSDRFFLGGHIHFGNMPFTFHHVRILDRFLAIPFSLAEANPSFKRRNNYGRLGSVRKNKFQGFEYRVLPSWFKQIPVFLPVLEWIEFLLENADEFPSAQIAKKDLNRYYQHNYEARLLEDWIEENKGFFLVNGAEEKFLGFVNTLKK